MVEVAVLSARITGDASGLRQELSSASQSVTSFGQSVQQGIGMGLGFSAFQAVLSTVGTAFGALKGSAIDFNQTLDGAAATMSRYFKTTQDVSNSMAFLNELAAKTPFAFEGLLTAQQRTIGAARSAAELKSNMDAIAVAASNTGKVSTANMDRISLALGQMQTKGKLSGEELLQLTEAGVNMGEILARHFGVSTAAISKMASEGKISAQEVWAALRENAADPRNREALEKMAKTWEGAWSTISDVGKTAIAGVFRPFFDLLTEGAVAVANFLQSDTFKVWAQVVTNAFSVAAQAVRSFLAFLAPVGQMIASAFQSFTLGNVVMETVSDAIPQFKSSGVAAGAAVSDGLKTGMESAKSAVGGLDDQIRAVGRTIQGLDFEHAGLKNQIEDVKRGYEDQIRPLKDQLELIEQKRHEGEKEQEIQFRLQEIELRRAQVQAMGDPIRRAELTRQLELLKAKQQELGIEDSIADVARQKKKLAEDGKKAQLEDLQYSRQKESLEERLKAAKKKKGSGDVDEIKSQLKELELRRQIALDQRKSDQEEAARKRKALDLKGQELGVQKELSDMTDKAALAEIAAAKEQLTQAKEDFAVQKELNEEGSDRAKAEVLAQIKALKAEEEARLRPMEDQVEALSRQKQEQEEIRKGLQAQKQDLQDVVAGYKEAAKAAKENPTVEPGRPEGGISFDLDPTSERNQQRIKAAAAAIGVGLQAAISEWLTKNPITLESMTSWASAFLDWVRVTRQELLNRLAGIIEGVARWIEENARTIGDRLYSWALAWYAWVPTAGIRLLDQLGGILSDTLTWIGAATIYIAGKLADWGAEFIAWVRPRIPGLLEAFGGALASLVEWIGSNTGKLIDALAEWAVAFIDWVGPKIPPLLEELGKLLAELGDWAIRVALPAITSKLAEWASAFVDWVGPRIEPLVTELIKLNDRMQRWIVFEALPAIIRKLGEWGAAFIGWVAKDAIPKIWAELDKLETKVNEWISKKVEDFIESAKALGEGMIQGIQNGLTSKWGELKNWITENIGKQLPDWMQQMLGIHSPSTVFFDIGQNLIAGLIGGMESKRNELIDHVRGMAETLGLFNEKGDSGGKVRDYIIKAARERGIDPRVALRIAKHEGGEDDYMQIGKFKTGWSFWPFQLHYAMKGMPGVTDPTAGMGDDFTRKTGWQPGDWRAWKESIDFALDHAKRYGWGAWYGRGPAGVDEYEGIPGFAKGGILPEDMFGIGRSGQVYKLHGGEGVFNPEQMAHLAPRGGEGGNTTVTVNVYGSPLASRREIADAMIVGLREAQRQGRTKVAVV